MDRRGGLPPIYKPATPSKFLLRRSLLLALVHRGDSMDLEPIVIIFDSFADQFGCFL
jgi:hypothetical protein